MKVEPLDIVTAADFQAFDTVMAEFQRFEEKKKTNASHSFPEAMCLQRFGTPGPHGTWYKVYCWMKYLKEVELGAINRNETYQMVAEYLFHLSMAQGWFQFERNSRLPGGKRIENRNGSKSLKAKTRHCLFIKDRPLKEYDDTRYVKYIRFINHISEK